MNQIRGSLEEHVPLARYNAWRVGGAAERLFVPADLADWQMLLAHHDPRVALSCLGLGSNSLVRDGGIAGVVVVTQGSGLSLLQRVDDVFVHAEAGVSCAQLSRFASRLGLCGLEFLATVPGTVGGALAMNAGCYGSETWSFVETVQWLCADGSLMVRKPGDFTLAYRTVISEVPGFFGSARFRLQLGDRDESLEKIRTYLAHRANTQPIDKPNCGSVFRNPPDDHAGRLIEACGLKGYREGGAMVSHKHANFIVNEDHASAADIETLIFHVQKVVQDQQGVLLHPEVRVVGEALK